MRAGIAVSGTLTYSLRRMSRTCANSAHARNLSDQCFRTALAMFSSHDSFMDFGQVPQSAVTSGFIAGSALAILSGGLALSERASSCINGQEPRWSIILRPEMELYLFRHETI